MARPACRYLFVFGIKLAPGIDLVRILATSGKQGRRPCLWEGHPAKEVESAIDSDLRVRRWLTKHRLIKDGVVSLTLSIECYSDGRQVDTFEVKDINLFIRQVKRKPQAASDEVVSRSIQVLDSTIKTLVEQLDRNWKTVHQQLEERDTVIGRLVQRGLEPFQIYKTFGSRRSARMSDTVRRPSELLLQPSQRR